MRFADAFGRTALGAADPVTLAARASGEKGRMNHSFYSRLTTVLRTDRLRVSRFRPVATVRIILERQNAQHLVASPLHRCLQRTEMGNDRHTSWLTHARNPIESP